MAVVRFLLLCVVANYCSAQSTPSRLRARLQITAALVLCTVDSAEGEVSAAEAPVMKADVRRWSVFDVQCDVT